MAETYLHIWHIFFNKENSPGCYFVTLFCYKYPILKLKIHQVSNDTAKIFELFKIYEENRLPSMFNGYRLLSRDRFTKLLNNSERDVLIFSAIFSCL